MLVNNFSIGIFGMLLAIIGFLGIGPFMTTITGFLTAGVNVLVTNGLLPLVAFLVEPAKVLFLNNAPLAEVLAHLEAPLLVLERHLPPVRVAVHLRARLEVLADRVGASVAPVAPAHAVLHLVCDRRDRASEHCRHLGEGQSAFEPVGYAFPRV